MVFISSFFLSRMTILFVRSGRARSTAVELEKISPIDYAYWGDERENYNRNQKQGREDTRSPQLAEQRDQNIMAKAVLVCALYVDGTRLFVKRLRISFCRGQRVRRTRETIVLYCSPWSSLIGPSRCCRKQLDAEENESPELSDCR